MNQIILRVKRYTRRQLRSFRHAIDTSETMLQHMTIGYKAFLFFIILFPLIFMVGFMIGCLTLTNPIHKGIDFLEDIT